MPRASKPIATDRRRRRWRIPDPDIQSACYPNTVRETLLFRPDFPADYVNVPSLRDAQVEHPPESPPFFDTQDDHCLNPILLDSEKSLPVESTQHIHRDPDGPKSPRESRTANILRRRSKLSSNPISKHQYPFAHVIQSPPEPTRNQPPHDEPHEFSSRQTNQHPQNNQHPQDNQYPQNNQHLQNNQHPQDNQYPQNNQHPQNNQYLQNNQHPQNNQYLQNNQHPQNNQYLQNNQYPQNNQHPGGYQIMHPKLAAELRELREITQEDKRRIEHLHSELAHSEIQIRALKHTISKVRTTNTAMATDSQIETDYKYFVAQLKNWTLSHFRGCKPTHIGQTIADFGLAGTSFAAGAAKLLAENTPRRFQAVTMLVMVYLDKHVFSAFLFGAEDKEQQLLESLYDSFRKTATPREIHFWRSNTLKMVVATESHRRRVRERKRELVAEIESLLVSTIPPNGNAEKRTDSLRIVVDQAVALALTLRVQRANYFLYYESPGKKLQEEIMELEGGADDDSDDESGGESSGRKFMEFLKGRGQKRIGLTVFPALIKDGNDEGENYNDSECLFKAKVLGA